MQSLRKLLRLQRKANLLGKDAKCEICGERDIRVLQNFGNQVLCVECRKGKMRISPFEDHHVAGRKNDDFTIRLLANDHAVLSDSQYDRPKEIR